MQRAVLWLTFLYVLTLRAERQGVLVFRYNTARRTTFYEPGTSVSIVSGYGLDDQAIEVRSPAEAKGTCVSRPALGPT
jgi:hypothetical protein